MPRRRPHALAPLALAFALAPAASCSLGNVAQDDCLGDGECAALFGLGSKCVEGYCTDAPSCKTGHDCRHRFGGGACVSGRCTAELPRDDACPVTEPADLFERRATGDDAPLVFGSIFSLDASFDDAQTKAVRLAVREINRTGGLAAGRTLGIVFCDNGGDDNAATGEARRALNKHALDYLAGTLGVPALVGPLTSSDSLTLVAHALARRYPTLMISPSATSPALTEQPDRLDPEDPYGLFWRTCPNDTLQAEVLASFVIGADPTIDVVAVVYIQDAYGEGLTDVFRARFGVDRTAPFPFDASTDDGALADHVAASDPDAILVVSVEAARTVSILGALASRGLTSKKYFFTDGSKDPVALLDPSLPPAVRTILESARGTAPAAPKGKDYELFETNLFKDFELVADQYAFLAQSYDATYVAAYGAVRAASASARFDGRDVAEGLAHLASGAPIRVGPLDWPAGKSKLGGDPGEIDVRGTSGDLDFDPATGEAPGPIEVWAIQPGLSGFETVAEYYAPDPG